MKIFLDVGAYTGEVAKAVLTSKYSFDEIHCFEPQLKLCETISKIDSDKVNVHPFGLWEESCIKDLFRSGRKKTDGSSIYPDKFGEAKTFSTKCKFVKASEWFSENVKIDDFVVLKINCEGAECDILDDLFKSGEYKKIDALMIDFDVRKSPSQKYKEEEFRKKIKEYNIPNVFITGSEEESKFGSTLHNMYYLNRERWTHHWMDEILINLI